MGEELRPLEVEIHTPEYLILGTLMTRRERLKHALGNSLHPFIAIHQATISNSGAHRQRQETEAQEAMVRPSEIMTAVPHQDGLC